MAVHSEAYTVERYLAALSVFGSSDLEWLAIQDVDAHADIEPGLRPEIEALDDIGVLERLYADGENVRKYRPAPGYVQDASILSRYFKAEYGDGLGDVASGLNEEDVVALAGETDVVELLR